MKKLLLIPALLVGSLTMASQYDYEITPVIGYNINENNLDLNNHSMFGLEAQFNKFGENIHPELSILYSKGEYDTSGNEPDMFRIALNGVYEYKSLGFITPLAKAGVGYRNLDINEANTHNTLYVDAGIGAKIPITKHIALKLEAVYMLDHNNVRWDSDISALAGINIAFGNSTPKPAPVVDVDNDGVNDAFDKCLSTPSGVKVDSNGCKVDGDDDNDGVKNSVDICPSTPLGTEIDANGCKVDGDDDNDGIKNSVDLCLSTPAGTEVESNGCAVDGDNDGDGISDSMDKCPNTVANDSVTSDGCVNEINLQINFKTGSSDVDAQSKENIIKFTNFLNATPSYSAEIIGYTDNIGNSKKNKKLSLKRATAVTDMIKKQGVADSRVSATGMGEENPVADNTTKEGRAQNRRVQAKLSQN